MSTSHVVVLDSTARRAVIKVTPTTHLSDILQEACTKLNLKNSQYGLRNNNKQVDLSRTIRLSGLSSGAKLELVLLSRSPSIVSVALQLPDTEARNGSSGRLVDKFPSTTTLWLVLRRFESGTASEGGTTYNLTARGAPQTAGESSGSGRLFYETPVLHVMGRELSTFTDLQKTLSQLGYNSGSMLLRLSFRTTQTPLEEAMGEMEQYFKPIETDQSSGVHASSVANLDSTPDPGNQDALTGGTAAGTPSMSPTAQDTEVTTENAGADETRPLFDSGLVEEERVEGEVIVGPDQRPMSIFAPPRDVIPQAARHDFNEADYEPTIDHAKRHQSRLSTSGRNRRLPSEAELKAQEESTFHRLSTVKNVEIKIRYPDQTQVVSTFTSTDTVTVLYSFVQSMLQYPEQPFLLSYPSVKGPKMIAPEERNVRLIQDLGFSGRMLINFKWDEKASSEARSGPVLQGRFVAAARQIQVEEVKSEPVAAGTEQDRAHSQSNEKTTGQGSNKRGMPKWLKLAGKK